MDSRLYYIQTRLPKQISDALEQNRGDGNAVWSLLEMCRENGYINNDEETILYNEYIVVNANHDVYYNAQPQQNFSQQYQGQTNYNSQTVYAQQPATAPQQNYNQQYNPQYDNQNAQRAEFEQKAKILYYNFTSGKRKFVAGIVVAVIALLYALFSSAIFSDGVDVPENLSDSFSSITAGTDYFIKDATILTVYAEYYQAPENLSVTGDDIPEGQKRVTDDFYLAIVTDSEGNQFITSLSFKHDSDLAKKLRAFDFENNTYKISGYFEAKTLSSFSSDMNQYSISTIFDEVIFEISTYWDYEFETFDWDFEFVHPEDYDYKEQARIGKTAGTIVSVAFVLLAAGMVFLAVSGKKKQKKAAAELAEMGISI